MNCYKCGKNINIDFNKIPNDVKTFDTRCENCGVFIKVGNPLYMEEIPLVRYYFRSISEEESIKIYKNKISYENKKHTKPNGELIYSYKMDIDDKTFVDSMILGNAYMPLKSKMIDSYNNVKKIDSKEINRPKNSSKKIIEIKDKDFIASIDMYISEYGDVFDKFIKLVKKMIKDQIESNF